MNANDFFIEEYKWLRGEISEKVKETRTLERYTVLATGAVWAWLFTATDSTLPLMAWYIPFALACASALRSLALLLEMWNTAIYIRRIEEQVKDARTAIGWETWIQQQVRSSKPMALSYVVTTIIFWFFLLGGTFIGGMLLPC